MKRSLWVLVLILLSARPGHAKEKEAVVPPPADRAVMVSWEDGRVSAKKEAKGGTLIAWEPSRASRAAIAPPVSPLLRPTYSGARQFDIEEYPLMPSQGAMQVPSRILPAAAAFTPYTDTGASQEDSAASFTQKSRSS